MPESMIAKLEGVEKRFVELETELSNPGIVGDRDNYRRITREHSELSKVVETFRRYKKVQGGLDEGRELMGDSDPEMRALARVEVESLEAELQALMRQLKVLLLPRDPNDEKDVILEIRAGTGGEEAALFAGELFRMYSRFAELQRWKVEFMSASESDLGGFKEVIASISGDGVYSRLKYESGVHRVQRVPVTESQGRVHTSAVTVAVLPEAEEVELDIKPDDLRIDVFRSSGPGGQHVNKTESAVRITHLPTNTVVICQDEKSQHKNKAKAMKVLRARLWDKMRSAQNQEIAAERRALVGSGDRSERIRTYNYPQNRVTDHRINLTVYALDRIMEGELGDQIIEPLITTFQARAMESGGL
jgi:peptide chain release factor 1